MTRWSVKQLATTERGRRALGMTEAPVRKPPGRIGVANGWESAAFVELIAPRIRSGEVRRAELHAISLLLYGGSKDARPSSYRPDWTVWRADGGLEFLEVKGHEREASIVRIKSAARIYPEFRFVKATGGPGNWTLVHYSAPALSGALTVRASRARRT